MLFTFAMRNIFRNKRRTLLTIGMMTFGFVFFSMFISLSDGVYGNIINTFILEKTGHLQIHKKGYLDRPRITKSISHYKELMQVLLKDKSVLALAPRIRGGALAFGEKKHLGISVVGIDPQLENKLTNLSKKIRIGEYLNNSNLVVIGKRIKEVLQLKIGSRFILLSQGADGSIANDLFEVGGIIETNEESSDDGIVYMTIDRAQQFFSLHRKVHELAIRLNRNIAREYSRQLNYKIDQNLLASPWQDVEKDFYRAMEADKKSDSIGRMIFMLVVIIGVLNTVLMSILERTQEFGVLKALGTRPYYLFKLIIIETGYLAILSIILGSLIAFGVNYYLSTVGIYIEPFEYGGMRFEKMVGIINLKTFWMPAATIFFSSIVVTIFPAFKAAHITPVEAMRSF